MIPVHYFELQKIILSGSRVLLYRHCPQNEVRGILTLFPSCLARYVNSKQQFNITGAYAFLNDFFFHLLLVFTVFKGTLMQI